MRTVIVILGLLFVASVAILFLSPDYWIVALAMITGWGIALAGVLLRWLKVRNRHAGGT